MKIWQAIVLLVLVVASSSSTSLALERDEAEPAFWAMSPTFAKELSYSKQQDQYNIEDELINGVSAADWGKPLVKLADWFGPLEYPNFDGLTTNEASNFSPSDILKIDDEVIEKSRKKKKKKSTTTKMSAPNIYVTYNNHIKIMDEQTKSSKKKKVKETSADEDEESSYESLRRKLVANHARYVKQRLGKGRENLS